MTWIHSVVATSLISELSARADRACHLLDKRLLTRTSSQAHNVSSPMCLSHDFAREPLLKRIRSSNIDPKTLQSLHGQSPVRFDAGQESCISRLDHWINTRCDSPIYVMHTFSIMPATPAWVGVELTPPSVWMMSAPAFSRSSAK